MPLSPKLRSLLGQGYFAKELPTPFTTKYFGSYCAVNQAAVDPAIKALGKKLTTHILRHDILNSRLKRRILGVPNPIHQYKLADLICNEWTDIYNFCHSENFSKSRPIVKRLSRRAIEREHDFSRLPSLRSATRSGFKYVLKLDIARFYPSIYTHSIPWAIHTKPIAKAKKDDKTLLGNRLDFAVRVGQDGQTIGIPVGPDTSLVIAETVLSRLDASFTKLSRTGFRYVDDFELAFRTYSECENALAEIRSSLKDFELEINQQKVDIKELPCRAEPIWVSKLRQFEFKSRSKDQFYDLVDYCNLSFDLAKEYPTESVLTYAVQVLRYLKVYRRNWSVIEDFLFQILAIDYASINTIFAFLELKRGVFTPNLKRLEFILNTTIQEHAQSRRVYEVAWSTLGAINWGIDIDDLTAEYISKLDDSIVALTALDAYHQGRIKKLDTKLWDQYVNNSDALYGPQWLLAYEANFKGWLKSRKDHVAANPFFSLLKSNGVYFYEQYTPIPPVTTDGYQL